uniref:Transmembrane protein n=1 Tax=Populus davidiana TaxID=266767 RepID=A0A6M2EG69_9ROSI
MARFGFSFLIFVGILVLQAMADDKSEVQNGVKTKGVEGGGKPASSPMEAETETESGEAEAPGIRRLGKHHSSDKSVAGGGVILGGLVTAIFAAVFCYIRVTRRRHGHQGGH